MKRIRIPGQSLYLYSKVCAMSSQVTTGLTSKFWFMLLSVFNRNSLISTSVLNRRWNAKSSSPLCRKIVNGRRSSWGHVSTVLTCDHLCLCITAKWSTMPDRYLLTNVSDDGEGRCCFLIRFSGSGPRSFHVKTISASP
jgi:hypothetical protein